MVAMKYTADFETRSRANLKKTGAYEYSMDPSTIATCFGVKFANRGRILLRFEDMQKPFWKLPIKFQQLWIAGIKNGTIVFKAHSAFFEQCIYNNVLVKRFGWPPMPIHKWGCTAAQAAAVAIPRNLDGAGQVMNLKIQKSHEGHRVMLKLCKPTAAHVKWKKHYDKLISKDHLEQAAEWKHEEPDEFWTPETAPEDYEILYKYCGIDVTAEELLDESLPQLSPFERKLWIKDQEINMRGVAVDMEVVKKISAIMASETKILGKELDILTMGLVSSGNARNAILDFLSLEGLELPDLKAKTVDDFLANGKATGDAKKLLEIRRALSKASTAKYQKFIMCALSDGRARDLFLYHAASTGRWGGKNVQPQNFPRGVIKDIDEAIYRIKTCDLEDLKMLYGDNLMPLFSSVLRGMFIPTKGWKMYVEDYSAIECRITWWLADHQEGLDLFRRGEDPYKHMAVDIYLRSILEIDDDQRQVGKAATLGCGFQMGDRKFISSAWDVYRAKVTKEIAKVAVTAYRKKHWPVVEMWKNYQNAAIFAVENPGKVYKTNKVKFYVYKKFLWAELPSGRRLAYKDPQVVWTDVPIRDDDGNIVKTFKAKQLRYYAVNHKAKKEDCHIPGVKWTREATYGGKLTENIVQAISRDLLAEAILRVEDHGFKVLMHSHDELVSEAKIGKFKSEIDSKGVSYCPKYRELMEVVPKWAKGLPVKAGGWDGFRYKKG